MTLQKIAILKTAEQNCRKNLSTFVDLKRGFRI